MAKRSKGAIIVGRARGFRPIDPIQSDPSAFELQIDKIGRQIEPHPLGCWLWTGTCDAAGYAMLGVGGAVHRAVYRILVGPIPEDHHLHHTCGTRRCVNPAHLEPLTPSEHMSLHARMRHSQGGGGMSKPGDNSHRKKPEDS